MYYTGTTAEQAAMAAMAAGEAGELEIWRDGQDGPYVAVVNEADLPRDPYATTEWDLVAYALAGEISYE